MGEESKIETKKYPEYLSQDEVQEVFDRSIEELSEFFEIQLTNNIPKLNILNSREEIDKINGSKTESWVQEFVKDGNIYLIAPDKVNTETSHKYTKETYSALVKHETCHIFVYVKNIHQCG